MYRQTRAARLILCPELGIVNFTGAKWVWNATLPVGQCINYILCALSLSRCSWLDKRSRPIGFASTALPFLDMSRYCQLFPAPPRKAPAGAAGVLVTYSSGQVRPIRG